MPRFVRSAYITGHADGIATPFSTGPREKGRWLSADVTLRTSTGGVSDPINVTAGGLEHGTQAAHAFVKVPASMTVTLRRNGDGSTELHITQNPAD